MGWKLNCIGFGILYACDCIFVVTIIKKNALAHWLNLCDKLPQVLDLDLYEKFHDYFHLCPKTSLSFFRNASIISHDVFYA